VNFDTLRYYVDRFQGGTWPEPRLNVPSTTEEDSEVICE
jgi:hypothetical protein